MLYVFICLMVGLAIVSLALLICDGYTWVRKVRRNRAADRTWKESDR